jgi:histidinol phosphatase-like enzyme
VSQPDPRRRRVAFLHRDGTLIEDFDDLDRIEMYPRTIDAYYYCPRHPEGTVDGCLRNLPLAT